MQCNHYCRSPWGLWVWTRLSQISEFIFCTTPWTASAPRHQRELAETHEVTGWVWKWNWELQLGWTEIHGPNKSTTLHGNTYHSKRSLCFHFPKFSIQRLCFNLFPFPKQTLQRTLSSLIAEQKHHSLLYSSVSLTLSWPWGCDCCCVTIASACRLLLPQLSPQGYPTMGKAAPAPRHHTVVT